MINKIWIILITTPFLFSFLSERNQEDDRNFIPFLLKSDTSSIIKEVFEHSHKYRLQIAFTQINRDKNNQIRFRTYTYRTDLNEYFYPASMAKLPVAALTLEKLNSLHLDTIPFDSLNLLVKDPHNHKSLPVNLSNEYKKLFVVSNNTAFNNLYDLTGQEYINQRLWEMGYKDSRVIQKFLNTDSLGHRTSFPVKILNGDSVVYQRDSLLNPIQWKNNADSAMVGKAFLDEKKIIHKPKDFSYSNYLPLTDLHEMLISLIYPNEVPEEKRFKLKENDYSILHNYMKMYPREANMEELKDENIYYDSFRKYLLVGNSKQRIDSCINIYNKVGQAYGFMTDCAYIVDYSKDIEFFLSATLYVNNDEILNDGKYEYNSIGFPFLARLGEIFYNHELKRTKRIFPFNKKR